MIIITLTIIMIMVMVIIHTTITTIIIILPGILHPETLTEGLLLLTLQTIIVQIIQVTGTEGVIMAAIVGTAEPMAIVDIMQITEITEITALTAALQAGEIQAAEIQVTVTMETAAIQGIMEMHTIMAMEGTGATMVQTGQTLHGDQTTLMVQTSITARMLAPVTMPQTVLPAAALNLPISGT